MLREQYCAKRILVLCPLEAILRPLPPAICASQPVKHASRSANRAPPPFTQTPDPVDEPPSPVKRPPGADHRAFVPIEHAVCDEKWVRALGGRSSRGTPRESPDAQAQISLVPSCDNSVIIRQSQSALSQSASFAWSPHFSKAPPLSQRCFGSFRTGTVLRERP